MDRKNELPDCKWGAACYRTNPEHLLEFRHPGPGTETNSVKSHEGTTTSQLPGITLLLLLVLMSVAQFGAAYGPIRVFLC